MRDLRWWHRPSENLSRLTGVNPIELVEYLGPAGPKSNWSRVAFHDLGDEVFEVRSDELEPYIPVPVEDPVALEQWLDA